MMAAKLCCGLWLLRIAAPIELLHRPVRIIRSLLRRSPTSRRETSPQQRPDPVRLQETNAAAVSRPAASREAETTKPRSLYPALILGSAMVTRGEIGYLISSLAESGHVLGPPADGSGSDQPSEIFIISTWAITLCTIAGPITMGLLVRRVRRLEGEQGSRQSVLGVWGVQ